VSHCRQTATASAAVVRNTMRDSHVNHTLGDVFSLAQVGKQCRTFVVVVLAAAARESCVQHRGWGWSWRRRWGTGGRGTGGCCGRWAAGGIIFTTLHTPSCSVSNRVQTDQYPQLGCLLFFVVLKASSAFH